MSFGSDPNPFQQMGGARPKQPSMVPKIIAVIAALVIVAMCGGAAMLVTRVGGGLAQGLYGNRNKETAKNVSADELWNEFNDDEEEAAKVYKDRPWVVVTGECSEVGSFRPEGSALNEEYIQIGLRDRKLGGGSSTATFPQNVKLQPKQANGIVSIRGKVKGRISGTGPAFRSGSARWGRRKFSIK